MKKTVTEPRLIATAEPGTAPTNSRQRRPPSGRLYPRHQRLQFINTELPEPSMQLEAMSAFQIAVAFMEWFTRTLGFLAIVAAGLAAVYLYDFKVQYGIPVALGSPSMMGAWPIVFGFVMLATTAFAALVMSPSAVLWIRMDGRGRRLIDGHRPARGARGRNPLGGTDLGRAWLAAQVIAVGMLLRAMTIFSEYPWLASMVMVSAVALATVALDGVRRSARISRWGVLSMVLVITYCLFVQCAGATVIFKFAFMLGSGNPTMTEAIRWMAGTSLGLAVVFLQYFFATRVKGGLRLEAIQQALFICLGFAVMPLASPTFAARLPATLFQEHDRQQNTCVRLVASSEAA